MKKVFFILLFVSFSFGYSDDSEQELHKALDHSIEHLEKYLNEVEESYGLFVNSLFYSTTNYHYFLSKMSYVAVANEFQFHKLPSLQDQLLLNKEELRFIKRELSGKPQKATFYVGRLMHLETQTKSLYEQILLLKEDLSILSKGFVKTCENHKVKNVVDLYKPQSLFASDTELAVLEHQFEETDFSISVSIGSHNGIEGDVQTSYNPHFLEGESGEAIDAVAGALSTLCGFPAAFLCAGGYVAAKLFVQSISFYFETRGLYKKIKKQERLVRKINSIKSKSLAELKKVSFDITKSSCQNQFDDELFLEVMNNLSSESSTLRVSSKELFEKVKEFKENEFENILTHEEPLWLSRYFEKVENTFGEVLKSFFQDKDKFDKKVKDFFFNVMGPDLKKHKDSSNDLIEKTLYRDKLWSHLIWGDFVFFEKNKSSFLENQDASEGHLKNYWSSVGSAVLKEISYEN